MNRTSSSILIAPLLLAAAACTDSLPEPARDPAMLLDGDYTFVILQEGDDPASRMTYVDEIRTVFETGDRLGVFVPTEETQKVNDIFSARNISTDKDVLVLVPPQGDVNQKIDDTAEEFLFYYPYKATYTLSQINDGVTFTVKTDQSTKENFQASDLLWANLTGDAAKKDAQGHINITMQHAMASIVIKIDADSINAEKGITLLNLPYTANGIKLRSASTPDDLAYTPSTAKLGDIKAWHAADADRYAVYRAVVPAGHTIPAGTPILSLDLANDNSSDPVTYSLAADLTLLPGHYYTFNLRSGDKPFIPDQSDDDSWVLEVTDPADGELVGYLCREYLYYEPDGKSTYRTITDTDGSCTFDKPTSSNTGRNNINGGHLPVTFPGPTDEIISQLDMNRFNTSAMWLAINSQAWVFYNLKPGTSVPDLTSGTVLRFIFDVVTCGNLPGNTPWLHPAYTSNKDQNNTVYPQLATTETGMFWPLPHTTIEGEDAQGIFKTRHGHSFINTVSMSGWPLASPGYGYDSTESLEYYMHGGTVTWDPVNNIIDDFVMPEVKVTTRQAESFGHVAIRHEGGSKTVTISYTPLRDATTDDDGAYVGQTAEKTVTVGDVSYPLRKVGFNQFWTGKSLRSKNAVNGEPLTCFDLPTGVGDISYDPDGQDVLDPGFLYPAVSKGMSFDVGGKCKSSVYDDDFFPFRDGASSDIALLYNVSAIADKKIIPSSSPSENWHLPSWKEIAALRRYGGFCFAAKWTTDEIRTRISTGVYAESTTTALQNGWLLGTDSYCANISGLDFKPFGVKNPLDSNNNPERGLTNQSGATFFFFVDSENDNIFESEQKSADTWIEMFNFNPWDCWGTNPLNGPNFRSGTHFKTANNDNDNRIANSRVFASVRLVMSFNDPVGAGAIKARMPKAPAAAKQPRNVNVNIIPTRR